MERALPSVFDSVRNFGLAAYGSPLDDRMTWALGVFGDTDDFSRTFDNDLNFALSGRVTGLPWYADDGRKLVHLGVSASRQFRDGIDVRFRQRPEAHLAERFLDTGDVLSDGNILLAAEAALVYGPLSIQAEYKPAWIEQRFGDIAYMQGAYGFASWFLTGEHRPYDKKKGVFKRLVPNNPFNPTKGQWGAWELAVRYSFLDLVSAGIDGGREANVTGGVNWYLYGNVRLTANYVYADVRNTGSQLGNAKGNAHIFQMRTYVDF